MAEDAEEPTIDEPTRHLILLGVGMLKALKSFWRADPGSAEEIRSEETLVGGAHEIVRHVETHM